MGLISRIILLFALVVVVYMLLSLLLTIFLAKGPSRPVNDRPDWGITIDERISTRNGKKIELWVVYPDGTDISDERSKEIPAVIMTHGWSRNRGRMVSRARQWKDMGFTIILISTRNHGGSDKERIGSSIVRFSHDIEDVVEWWGQPVIIQGHSIGAGATILTASRQNRLIRAMVLEAPVRSIPDDLYYIYKPVFKKFTNLILPGMKIMLYFFFFPYRKQGYSPIKLLKKIEIPALFIHGKKDPLLPFEHSEELHSKLDGSSLCLLENADHSSIPDQPDYIKCIKYFVNKNKLF